MSPFPFRTDEESETFCRSIVGEMSRIFGITEDEAFQRVCQFWTPLPAIVGESMIYHETPDFWAREIYYERNSSWWFSEEERAKRGLPSLSPRPVQ